MSDAAGNFSSRFPTTHWTVVFNASNREGESFRDALTVICERYWYPVYGYIRRRGFSSDGAADHTQAFFVEVIEKDYLATARPARGRFRAFLLSAVRHFLSNQIDAGRTLKRGGAYRLVTLDAAGAEDAYGRTVACNGTPESVFEYNWALTVLERTLNRLRSEYGNDEFKALKPFLLGDAERGSYAVAATQLGISEGALRVSVHRLRKRYRDELRSEIAETVADESDIEEEVR
jgi:DNA-directed RNA polymerase specialized sigma24 family protein